MLRFFFYDMMGEMKKQDTGMEIKDKKTVEDGVEEMTEENRGNGMEHGKSRINGVRGMNDGGKMGEPMDGELEKEGNAAREIGVEVDGGDAEAERLRLLEEENERLREEIERVKSLTVKERIYDRIHVSVRTLDIFIAVMILLGIGVVVLGMINR